MKKKLLGALLSAVLLCAALPGAGAAEFRDLPATHWAYSEITRAVSYGIMNGQGDGIMNPDGTLTWAHYLAMLSRTFAPQRYAGLVYGGTSWQEAGYTTAHERGYLTDGDFLPVTLATLNTPISRQDVAVLLSRVLPEEKKEEPAAGSGYDFWWSLIPGGYSWWDIVYPGSGASSGQETPEETEPTAAETLTDFSRMDTAHQEAVSRLFDLNIVRGKADRSFGPLDTVRRSDGAVLLMRTLDAVDELRAGEELSPLTLTIADADGKPIGEPVTGKGTIGQSLYALAGVYAPMNYKAAPQDGKLTVAKREYTLLMAPLTAAEIERRDAEQRYRRGEITYEEYMAMDFWLRQTGNNDRKTALVFGGEASYATEEEAQAQMTTIEVPVWKLWNGKKSPGTLHITINKALAQDLTEIFTEIYNDPEQFPFESAGGYSWRGESSRSEHNQGTAVDVNADQNYSVRDAVPIAGSHWSPGEDPYSVTPGGSVVRIFAEHGWAWGGNAWSGHTDQSYGYHDYMHFSYFGT